MAKKDSNFKAGMYLLETLTAGMYNEPLSIYREYVQNSVDSFDIVNRTMRRGPKLVKIDLDPFDKYVSVYDNGAGIPAAFAEKVLSSIGSSEKNDKLLRGFRGIGRLGGLAFCDKAVFQTKHAGEDVESIQEWNCKELRKILGDEKMRGMDLRSLFEKTTSFYQENGKSPTNSYFKVTLHDVTSFRNHILDLRKTEKYLQAVAPLPFDPDGFKYSDEISSFLRKNVPNYGEYTIRLNGNKVYKPYGNRLNTYKKRWDNLSGIETFKLREGKDVIAYGWFGKRNELLGSLSKTEGISGIRVRAGNITIGDGHLLDNCYREGRFNGYMIGEVHVVDPGLVPNSRRDDFVDNGAKLRFYDAVERRIGLPTSKEIRLRSKLNSLKASSGQKTEPAIDGFTSKLIPENKYAITESKPAKTFIGKIKDPNKVLGDILEACGDCDRIKSIISKYQI